MKWGQLTWGQMRWGEMRLVISTLHNSASLSVCLLRHVRIAESERYCHSILFVCRSFRDLQPTTIERLIDHNQIWSAGIYLSSDPCKPFWIPYLPYFGCQREKYAKFRLFPMRILATANVTHRATWFVCLSVRLSQCCVSALSDAEVTSNQGRLLACCYAACVNACCSQCYAICLLVLLTHSAYSISWIQIHIDSETVNSIDKSDTGFKRIGNRFHYQSESGFR